MRRARRDFPEASGSDGGRATATPIRGGIARVRRGTRGGAAGKASRLYTVRATKVIDAVNWLDVHNPYYMDVTVGRSRLAGILGGSEIPDATDMNSDGGFFTDDIGPAPGQNEVGADASDAGYGTDGMIPHQR